MSKHFNVAVDADGIALITMDSPGRSMNVFAPEVEAELAQVVERVVGDAAIKGAIVTSGKPSFLAGYDLTEFLGKLRAAATRRREAYERVLAAGCSSCSGASRPAASPGSPRSTGSRSAADSSCASPAITASWRTTRRRSSACPK